MDIIRNIKHLEKKRIDLTKKAQTSIKSIPKPRNLKTDSPRNPFAIQRKKTSIKKNVDSQFSGDHNSPKRKKIMMISGIIAACIFTIGALVFIFGTESVPARGGELREGIIGQPQYINPVLSFSNDINKVDRNLEYLIYPRLFTTNTTGEIIPDLAVEYRTENNSKDYIIKINDAVTWDDGTPLSIDDVIYTIETIQNPAYNSPLANSLRGVTTEKIDQYSLKLSLPTSYSPFLGNLTFGILPRHIWSQYDANGFLLAKENLEPIGASRYSFLSYQKDQNGNLASYTLKRNSSYAKDQANIEKITFVFYVTAEAMIQDFERGNLNAFTHLGTPIESLMDESGITSTELKTPQYFGIFFNVKSPVFEDRALRQAINHAVNRDQIIADVLQGNATKVTGPLTPFNTFYKEQSDPYSTDEAKRILDEAGWKDDNADGTREKNGKNAEFTLLVANGSQVEEVINIIKMNLESVGIKMNSQIVSFSELSSSYIQTRSYEAIYIGESLNVYPDPYVYWHSSQSKAPGLNLSQYSNINSDGYLETSRTNTDLGVITSSLAQFQDQITQDVPAVFLYSPHFLYYTRKPLANMEPIVGNSITDRFSTISNWYARTKRVFK